MEGGKQSIHFNDSDENIELLLRTVISANQLSVYGSIADLCAEVPKDPWAPGKPAAPDHLEKMEIPTNLSISENSTNAQQRRNLVQEYERKFEQLSEDQKLIQTMFWCWFEACQKRTILPHSWYRRRTTDATFMSRIHEASKWKRDSYKRMDSQEYENRPSQDKSVLTWWSIQYRSSSPISISRQYRLLG